MRRAIAASAALMSAACLMSGCGFGLLHKGPKVLEVVLEVTGTAAEKITYTVSGDAKNPGAPTTVDRPTLPWRYSQVPEVASVGSVDLTVIPQGGEATCRIVVSRKQVAKKSAEPGTPLVCGAKLR